ncbi:glycoside hydrolase family 2 protein [Paenibacillus tengchongensis]|uniref:glycoside hydrolase family 2 protein n=1 Tax=Paenibacillus tengchongensis TaxID=2608684 RepID=UPI00124C4EA4|nr:glycoside hydrolase family 2 TIM barrel-domain containing protein [Paenibacillus tengchongensis]
MEQQGRTTALLEKAWKFQPDPEAIGLIKDWARSGLPSPEPVEVPHTWNVQPETENYRGLGWYECRFQAPELSPDNRVWLDFEAVYRDAVIWINGEQAGSHLDSGFTAFRIEATRYIKAGQENLLVISVDNGNSDTALPKGNSFDWADDGGIIREVYLSVTGEAAIDAVSLQAAPILPHAGQTEAAGVITGKVALHQALQTGGKELTLELLLQQDGKQVWAGTQTAAYPCTGIPLPEIKIEGAQLWHFDHPHLYEFTIRVAAGGELQDEVTKSIGFREFKTRGSQFLLNGEPVRLAGVEWMPGSHPDKGMAESEEDMKRVLQQLKQANCVLTRFHWQQSERLLDWCDRYGILVQEEIPLWQQPMEPAGETVTLAQRQLAEMISRHNHHPSVIAWGVGNELDGQSQQTVRYVKDMKAYIGSLDSGRLVNYVSNTVHFDPAADATGAGDVIMWNDYIGTWHGEHDMDETVKRLIAAYPDKPIVVSEFGLCEPAFSGGDVRRSEQLREKMDIYRKVPNIAGMIYFNLNDYRTQMGEEGEGRMRQRVHGVTDLSGNEKPSYRLLAEVSSPVRLEAVHSDSGKRLHLRVSCAGDLPAHSVSGYRLLLAAAEEAWEQSFDIPPLAPGDTAEFIVETPGISGGIHAVVRRPTGFEVLNRRIGQ